MIDCLIKMQLGNDSLMKKF